MSIYNYNIINNNYIYKLFYQLVQLKIDRCVFRDNEAGEGGGAIYINKGNIQLFYDSRFLDNSAADGGALKTNLVKKIIMKGSDFE